MVNGERGREAFVRHPGKPSENQTQCSYIQSVWWVPRGALLSKMPASQPSRAHHWHSWRHGHASWHAARHRRPHLREWNAGARLLREEHAWPPSLHQYGNRGAGQGRQSSNAERNQRPALIWLRDGLEAPTANGGHQDAREEAGCGPGAAPPPTCAGTANPAPGRAMTAAWDPPGGLPGGPGPAGSGGVGRGAEGSGGWSDTHSSSGRRRWRATSAAAPPQNQAVWAHLGCIWAVASCRAARAARLAAAARPAAARSRAAARHRAAAPSCRAGAAAAAAAGMGRWGPGQGGLLWEGGRSSPSNWCLNWYCVWWLKPQRCERRRQVPSAAPRPLLPGAAAPGSPCGLSETRCLLLARRAIGRLLPVAWCCREWQMRPNQQARTLGGTQGTWMPGSGPAGLPGRPWEAGSQCGAGFPTSLASRVLTSRLTRHTP
jgi:hypothetical protein